jgi:hypothetical protein
MVGGIFVARLVRHRLFGRNWNVRRVNAKKATLPRPHFVGAVPHWAQVIRFVISVSIYTETVITRLQRAPAPPFSA